jgi:predicted RNase H-like nuclease (RuvC/YqgF family)
MDTPSYKQWTEYIKKQREERESLLNGFEQMEKDNIIENLANEVKSLAFALRIEKHKNKLLESKLRIYERKNGSKR